MAYDALNQYATPWAWYVAEDIRSAGGADGSVVSAWTNKGSGGSLLGITGSPVLRYSALNSLCAVELSGSQRLDFGTITSGVSANNTTFMVMQLITPTSSADWLYISNSSFWISTGTTSPRQGWNWSRGGTGNTFYATTNQISGGTTFCLCTKVGGSTNQSQYPNANPNLFEGIDGQYWGDGGTDIGWPVGGYFSLGHQSYGGANINMKLCELVIYQQVFSHPQRLRLEAALARKYGLYHPCIRGQGSWGWVVQGNSTSTQNSSYAARFANSSTNASLKMALVNLASSGAQVSGMVSECSQVADVVNYFSRDCGLNVLHSGLFGHNDVSTGTDGNNISLLTNTDSTIQTSRRAGSKFLALTMTPWNGSSSRESGRAVLNGYITGSAGGVPNWYTFADAIFDLGGTPEFGVYDSGSAPAGTSRGDYPSYWADAVHFTVSGHDYMGTTRMAPVLNAATATISLTSNTPGSITLTHSGAPSGWSYQWYRSTTVFDPGDYTTRGTALSGQTSSTCTDTTATGGTQYYYMCLIYHGTPPSWPSQGAAWSNQVAVQAKSSTGVSRSRSQGV